MAGIKRHADSGEYIGVRLGTRIGNKINQINDNAKTYWNDNKYQIGAVAAASGTIFALLGAGYIFGRCSKKKHQ